MVLVGLAFALVACNTPEFPGDTDTSVTETEATSVPKVLELDAAQEQDSVYHDQILEMPTDTPGVAVTPVLSNTPDEATANETLPGSGGGVGDVDDVVAPSLNAVGGNLEWWKEFPQLGDSRCDQSLPVVWYSVSDVDMLEGEIKVALCMGATDNSPSPSACISGRPGENDGWMCDMIDPNVPGTRVTPSNN
ncbi:MAG: hypothetical protein ACOZAO_00910 [Patescibacteria group bacterium]